MDRMDKNVSRVSGFPATDQIFERRNPLNALLNQDVDGQENFQESASLPFQYQGSLGSTGFNGSGVVPAPLDVLTTNAGVNAMRSQMPSISVSPLGGLPNAESHVDFHTPATTAGVGIHHASFDAETPCTSLPPLDLSGFPGAHMDLRGVARHNQEETIRGGAMDGRTNTPNIPVNSSRRLNNTPSRQIEQPIRRQMRRHQSVQFDIPGENDADTSQVFRQSGTDTRRRIDFAEVRAASASHGLPCTRVSLTPPREGVIDDQTNSEVDEDSETSRDGVPLIPLDNNLPVRNVNPQVSRRRDNIIGLNHPAALSIAAHIASYTDYAQAVLSIAPANADSDRFIPLPPPVISRKPDKDETPKKGSQRSTRLVFNWMFAKAINREFHPDLPISPVSVNAINEASRTAAYEDEEVFRKGKYTWRTAKKDKKHDVLKECRRKAEEGFPLLTYCLFGWGAQNFLKEVLRRDRMPDSEDEEIAHGNGGAQSGNAVSAEADQGEAGSDGPYNNAAMHVTGTGVERGNTGRRRRVVRDDTARRTRGRSVSARGRGRGRVRGERRGGAQ